MALHRERAFRVLSLLALFHLFKHFYLQASYLFIAISCVIILGLSSDLLSSIDSMFYCTSDRATYVGVVYLLIS
jgi:hypothetical protein